MNWTDLEGRVQWLVDQLGDEASGNEAGRRLGIKGQTINFILKGRSKISFDILERMHRVTGVSLNWLVCQDGGPHDLAKGGHVKWPSSEEASIIIRTMRRPKRRGGERRTGAPKKRG